MSRHAKKATTSPGPVIDPAFDAYRTNLGSRMHEKISNWAEIWDADELFDCTIRLNRRLTRSLGLCRPARHLIDINKVLLEDENAALFDETLCHELAHLVIHSRLGRAAKPHGREWKSLMRAAGYTARASVPGNEIGGVVAPTRRARYEYEHHCSACDATMVARRTNHRWRCAICVNRGHDGYLDVTRRTID